MSAFGGTATFASGEVKHASKLPLLTALVLFIAGSSTIPLAFFFENRLFFVIGYLATPVLVLMCVAWDSLSQRNGSRDPWFSVNKKLSLAVRVVAMVSFVPGVIQIWQISIWFGELAVQNGWFQ
jgi:hypothetical protein